MWLSSFETFINEKIFLNVIEKKFLSLILIVKNIFQISRIQSFKNCNMFSCSCLIK